MNEQTHMEQAELQQSQLEDSDDHDCLSIQAPNCTIEIIRNGGSWPDDLPAFAAKLIQAVETTLDEAISASQNLSSNTLPHICDTRIAIAKSKPHINILLSSDEIIQALNREFRDKDKPTNVLSFPTGDKDVFAPFAANALGDIILAYETINAEAEQDAISLDHHSTHLVVHGLLHLFGLDHQDDDEAREMEQLETRILAKMNIKDPYKKCKTGHTEKQLASGE